MKSDLLKLITAVVFAALAPTVALHGQEFKVLNRTVQVHGFGAQGFVFTNQNNWLSMNTSQGDFVMTDAALNASSQISDKFRVGAQVYDRDVGQMGDWHPELDWAYGDYKFTGWLGVRAGKVKTALGLYNDTQDLNFLHTWAILPQSIYPLDLRSSTMAHTGGDVYGHVELGKKLGTASYTAYAGQRSQDPHGGYVLGLAAIGLERKSYGGWMQGEDLRWNTPISGLLVGASLMNQHITGNGVYERARVVDPFLAGLNLPDGALEREHSLKDDYYQYYFQYTHKALQVDGEYRREYRLQWVEYYTQAETALAIFNVPLDQRSSYLSAAYRVSKSLQLGAYSSWYFTNWSADRSLPVNHVYDKDITARFDLNSHWNIKVEGHFINGYGRFDSVRGFYEQLNTAGLMPVTRGVVVKTGFNF
jgi:hypothetical protein